MENWLHETLMLSSQYYRSCYWNNNTVMMELLQKELEAILQGPHGR